MAWVLYDKSDGNLLTRDGWKGIFYDAARIVWFNDQDEAAPYLEENRSPDVGLVWYADLIVKNYKKEKKERKREKKRLARSA